MDSITSKVRAETSLDLWRGIDEVIGWFRASVQEGDSGFIRFDMCEFYPGITEEPLVEALECVGSFVEISDGEADIVLRCRKSLLFESGEVWTGTGSSNNFDATVGSLDGAGACGLVGLYLLSSLRREINQEDVGLCRRGGLMVVKDADSHTLDSL